MRVYHRTSPDATAAILVGGFRDHEGYYGTPGDENGDPWRGVWLCDRPFDASALADGTGGVVLALNVPDDLLTEYEWVEEDKGYREFLVPADVVNRYGPPGVVDEDEMMGGQR